MQKGKEAFQNSCLPCHGVHVMPPFRKTEITDTDFAAPGAYLARPRR